MESAPFQQSDYLISSTFPRRFSQTSFTSRRPRLQINPVFIDSTCFNDSVQQLFCSPQSLGTTALLFINNQLPGTNQNLVLLSRAIATLGLNNELPCLIWSDEMREFEQLSFSHPGLIIKLAPTIETQALAISAFTKRVLPSYHSAVFISKSLIGFQTFGAKIKSYLPWIVTIFVYTRSEIRQELLYLRDRTQVKLMILYTEVNDASVILEEAHVLGMTSGEYHWICSRYSCYIKPTPPSYPNGLIAIDFDTSIHTQQVALKTAIKIWSKSIYHLISQSKAPHEKTTPSISCTRFPSPKWRWGKVFLRILRRMTRKEQRKGTSIFQVNIKMLQVKRDWSTIGNYSERQGLKLAASSWLGSFQEKKKLFEADILKLRVVTLDEPPYVFYQLPDAASGNCPKNSVECQLSASRRGHHFYEPGSMKVFSLDLSNQNYSKVCCIGFAVDLLKRLAEDIEFKFEMFEVDDGKWGSKSQKTGEWNGLVRVLLDDEADVVATSLKINTDRAGALDFTIPFYQTGVTILVKIRDGMVSPIAFLQPFSMLTWLVIFVVLANSCALFIYACDKVRGRILPLVKTKQITFFESYWIIYSMLFKASAFGEVPKLLAARFVTNVWAFFCVIFASSFMANLAAFMIIKEEFHDFSGIDDSRLSNPYSINPPMRFGTIPYGATEHLIKSNFPAMYEYMRTFTKMNVDMGVKAVRNDELDAFVYDASVLLYKAGRDKNCMLRTVGKWYAPTGYGFAFRKSSKTWLNDFNHHIIKYQVSGYLQHLEDFWLSRSCNTEFRRDLRASSELGIFNLISAFAILAASFAFCWTFFGLEKFLDKRRHTIRRASVSIASVFSSNMR